jgi:hypothetical protein
VQSEREKDKTAIRKRRKQSCQIDDKACLFKVSQKVDHDFLQGHISDLPMDLIIVLLLHDRVLMGIEKVNGTTTNKVRVFEAILSRMIVQWITIAQDVLLLHLHLHHNIIMTIVLFMQDMTIVLSMKDLTIDLFMKDKKIEMEGLWNLVVRIRVVCLL